MKFRRFVLFVIINTVCFFCGLSYAKDIPVLPDFNKNDRVLILAAHPDDETIGTGGVIQKALGAGAKLKVVSYTCGEHNELAFLIYEKHLVLKRDGFVYMGEVRKKETVGAMTSLGLSKEDIVVLGYPDFGTMEILTKYWDETKPYKSLLTRISHVPFKDALSYDAPYVGQSILKDLKKVILDFRPTKIFVSHPADTNRDHRALYLFLRVALWDLQDKIDQPCIFSYIVHVVGWPKPRGYHPNLPLNPPDKLAGVSWTRVPLDETQIKKKRDAIAFYKSQIPYNPPYLFTFARKNELFGDFLTVTLKRQTAEEIRWNDLQTNSEFNGFYDVQQESQAEEISGLAYAYKMDSLYVKFSLKKSLIGGPIGLGIYFLGYKQGVDFASMPKLYISVDNRGVRIKDKTQQVFVKGVETQRSDKTMVLKIPLSALGNPRYILTNIRSQRKDLPLSDLVWRILSLEEYSG